MKPMFLMLEDGAVFEGRSVTEALECGGLLSFYTGVVGYQELITDPANLGKIVVYTYPLIGNAGVNAADAESASPKAAGVLAKEYPPYYSNFRAEGSLKDYLDKSGGTVLGDCFDTRAIMLHLRKHGEMMAVVSGEKLEGHALKDRLVPTVLDYVPENTPIACAAAKPIAKAAVLDFGASKTFYKHLAALGIDATFAPQDADVVIVSDAPFYAVQDPEKLIVVSEWVGEKPLIGFGHGCSMVALACEGEVEALPFGDHGVNVPVKYTGGGRNEITVQNHNYAVVPGGDFVSIFENVHDGTCEGFANKGCKAGGANFLPNEAWFRAILTEVGVA